MDYDAALSDAERNTIEYEEEAKIAIRGRDAAITQSVGGYLITSYPFINKPLYPDAFSILFLVLSAKLEGLETTGKMIADAVNAQGYTLVERVENVYPRFTEIAYESISFGASLALGVVQASTGQDYRHLNVDDMIRNFEAMEPAGRIISEVSSPHYPILKSCSK